MQFIHTSRLTLTSDSDEFFDAVSDLAASLPDDFQPDNDDDGDVYVPTFAEKKASQELELERKRDMEGRVSVRSRGIHSDSTHIKHHSMGVHEASTVSGMKRSASDGGLLNMVETDAPGNDMQKSKSDSSRIDDNVSIVTRSDNTDDELSIVSKEQEELRNGAQLFNNAYR